MHFRTARMGRVADAKANRITSKMEAEAITEVKAAADFVQMR